VDTDLTFGEWLRRRRGGFGLTQAELARRLGCAPITLRKIEAEERRPSPELTQRMANALRVPAEQRDAFMRFARGELLAGEELDGAVQPAQAASGPHLPNPPYDIIGRDDILKQVRDALTTGTSRTRILTLIGPPGVGKTRLALEAAHQLRPAFADGAAFIELAPLSDARLVAGAVAQALEIAEGKGASIQQTVIAHLRNRRLLLVLDNFEHVLDAAPFVAQIAAECDGVSCLVTSRERLRLRAEHLLIVPTLELPHTQAAADVQRATAARLFAARASAVNPDFVIDHANAAAVAEVCRRLDGLPLAIELIAARAETLSPGDIVRQLEPRLPALVDGPRDLPARQQTLRNAIRWSFDRLTPGEQRVFAHLGVFAGGFTPDAAQAVLGDDAPVETALAALDAASLTQRQDAHSVSLRYALLETIREFALEELVAHDEVETARARHAEYFVRLAEATRGKLGSAQQGAWYARLSADLDNIRAALRWAHEHGRYEAMLEIGSRLYHFWWQRGLVSEGLSWLEMALPHRDGAPMDLQADGLVNAGVLAYQLDDYAKAQAYLLAGLEMARQADHKRLIRGALANLGTLMLTQGEFDRVEPYLTEAIAVSRADNDEAYARFTLTVLGDQRYRQGQFAGAHDAYAQALAINQACNDEEGMADSLWGLARTERGLGEYEHAELHCAEASALYRKLDHEQGEGWVINVRADIARDTGHLDEAPALYREALHIRLKHEDKQGCARVLDEAAQVLMRQHRTAVAVQVMSAADKARAELGGRMTSYECEQRDRALGSCRAALGERDCEAAWVAGRDLSLQQAVTRVV
jgi:predicted ATPase/DNA-binding XRE family transcriptional regulator